MVFLSGLAANILKWLLEKGGRFIYEKVTELVEKHEKEKRTKENLKDYKDAVEQKLPVEKRHEAARRLINGEKKK